MTLLGNLAAPAFSLVTGPILARTLAPEGRGVLAVSMATLALAPMVFAVGIPAAVLHFGARGALTRRIYVKLLQGIVGLSLVGTGAMLGWAWLTGPPYRDSLLVVALCLPIVLPLDCLRALLQADRRFGSASKEAWATTITRFAAILVLAAVGALTAVTATLVIVVTGTLATLTWLPKVRRMLAAGRGSSDLATPRSSFVRYSVAVWLGQFAALSNVRLDQVALAFLIDAEEIGIYAVAVTWAQLPLMVVSASQRVALVRSGTDWDDAFSARVTRLTVAAGACLAGAFALLAPVAIPLLFGQEYKEATVISYLLLPGLLAGFAGYMFGTLLAARGRPGAQSIGEVCGVAVTAIGLIMLVPHLGIHGAAITSSVCYAMTSFAWWFFLRRGGFSEPLGLVTTADVRWLTGYLRPTLRLRTNGQ
ncbi:oligosaccharide flippase family protein [Nocardioides sp. cx-173]|uniref:oligosaccharide flippase family protein n=1 Tax=Nocardioides sp. cx-173 TaxID=2898796 RepID=UPI001E3215E0|nr:oligosaccharide flippase family protein [Nocardioides sp. cx-173]MCD4526938.1 oligosaccharide flippase family protein [Nocardioides sp. cx-173]UGB41274.1 oligosaccharide flippase family protein [Nocardioides sp. cx-173]